MHLRICHLYPDLMNLYGDGGNVLAVLQRCRWRGIETDVSGVSLGDVLDFRRFDIIFMGGGQDSEQRAVAADLQMKKGESIRETVEDGAVVLTICGGYQLFGQSYTTAEGEELPGIGVFDARTFPGKGRLTGNVVVESLTGDNDGTLVGFENHGGRTYLGPDTEPIGRVLIGGGNNGEDGLEGGRYLNAYGTYLHGSLLPKNPRFADRLIEAALTRRYGSMELTPLDDMLEHIAHKAAVRRAGQTRR
ncbi:MAG: glutamine amidotransferase [bacterium]|nr:glutamine amidotransferase [bacterium]